MNRSLAMFACLALAATGLLSSCDSSSSTSSNGGGNGSSTTIPWTNGITYGSVTDSRDGKAYKTVKIGTQRWMAENLNYAGSGTTVGVCYNSSADSCTKYGRLYTWAEVMAGSTSSSTSPSGVQGVCPSGWHVPSDTEWTILTTYIGGESSAGSKLKSTSGWYGSGNGTDTYGFRALPGGYVCGGSSCDVGIGGNWWSATDSVAFRAWYRNMGYDYAFVYRNYYGNKTNGFSLRCSQD